MVSIRADASRLSTKVGHPAPIGVARFLPTDNRPQGGPVVTKDKMSAYWKANLRIVATLLVVWFAVSYGFGILLADWLDQFRVGGFKLGFFFAQQGSIYVFVVLIFVYVRLMNRLDRQHDVHED